MARDPATTAQCRHAGGRLGAKKTRAGKASMNAVPNTKRRARKVSTSELPPAREERVARLPAANAAHNNTRRATMAYLRKAGGEYENTKTMLVYM